MKFIFVLIFSILLGPFAGASTARNLIGDAIYSSDQTLTRSLPAASGTVMLSAGLIQTTLSGANGVTTAYVLPSTPASAASLSVYIDGILTSAYSLSTATITFTVAPVAGQKISATYTIY